jgi:hypothetical protein
MRRQTECLGLPHRVILKHKPNENHSLSSPRITLINVNEV